MDPSAVRPHPPSEARLSARDALRLEQALLERLVDTIPVMVTMYRPDTRVLRLNREFERLVGWSSADVADIDLMAEVYPDAAIRAEAAEFMASAEPGWRDFPLRTRDGRTIETCWANIRFADETHVGVGIEIGERKRAEAEHARLLAAEQRARHAAERLQALTAALSDALTEDAVADVVMAQGVTALGAYAGVITLRAGEHELEIRASTGYPPAACMGAGRRWPLGASIPIAEAARSGAAVLIESPEAWAQRYGSHSPASVSEAWAAVPIVFDRKPVGALLWTFDARQRFDSAAEELMRGIALICGQALERARLFDAERRARQAAEQANLARSRFLGAMSHELRTPLNAVLGYTDLLLLETAGPLTDTQRQHLERVRAGALSQVGLIEEILGFALIEAGREVVDALPFDAGDLLVDTTDLVRPAAEQKALALRVYVPPDPLVVVSDARKYRQIVLNLLGNAIKFTSRGEIDVSARRENGHVVVRVRDTGPGIAADQLDTIWQPFTQLDQGTTRSAGGAGLGLAVASRLAASLSGSLTCESAVGTGSTFILSVPAASA